MGRPASHVRSPSRPRAQDSDDRVFEDQTLTGAILLDEGSFERCHFKQAVLIYAGGVPPRLKDCRFEGVAFQFDGAAGRTLALLQAMSTPSSGLRDVFKASFPRLFGH